MNKSTLSITQYGAVRQILLDRPEALNALNGQMTDDLTDAFLEAQQDDQVKVVLLSGAGRAFWAGADLMEMGSGRAETRHTFQELMMSLIEFSKPLLIAVNGVGVGIGATICGMADAVFMSDQARLRCPFSSLGLTAEACSTVTFSALMGHQRASWFLMSSEWMDANACVEGRTGLGGDSPRRSSRARNGKGTAVSRIAAQLTANHQRLDESAAKGGAHRSNAAREQWPCSADRQSR